MRQQYAPPRVSCSLLAPVTWNPFVPVDLSMKGAFSGRPQGTHWILQRLLYAS